MVVFAIWEKKSRDLNHNLDIDKVSADFTPPVAKNAHD